MKSLLAILAILAILTLSGCARVYVLDFTGASNNFVIITVTAEVPKNVNANADIDPTLIPRIIP